jgi:hypothetical protein
MGGLNRAWVSVLLALCACREPVAPGKPPPEEWAQVPVLVGAGDIADCGSEGDEATAALLDKTPGLVFTLGDNVYPDGTRQDYASCYEPSWGRHRQRTRPAPGNHDYHSANAAPYFEYFGTSAGEPGKGYYSYTVGTWHVVVLNSELPVEAGSAQEQWLRADLAAHPNKCTLAYWHRPRFSSGPHGSDAAMQPLWQALHEAGAEVVLSGHDHLYERFAPQTPEGAADAARGLRQFVVGTGGKTPYSVATVAPNSEVRDASTHGVLKLSLEDGAYAWEFLPAQGGTFTDKGRGSCH